jgi:hypothetical protein
MAATAEGFTVDTTGLPVQTHADARLTLSDGTVHLERFMLPDTQAYASHSLLPEQDTLVDYWSVGRLEGDSYRVYAHEMRSAHTPHLTDTLPLGPGPGQPMVHIVDGLGAEHWLVPERNA